MGLTTCTVKHSPAHIHTHIHTQAALRRVQVEVKDLVERHPELMDTALVSHIRKVLLLPPKKEPAVDRLVQLFASLLAPGYSHIYTHIRTYTRARNGLSWT